MRPTLPSGFSVGELPEIIGVDTAASDFELYELRKSAGSPTHLLLVRETNFTDEVMHWIDIQNRDVVLAGEKIAKFPLNTGLGIALTLQGNQLSKRRLVDETSEGLERLLLAMISAVQTLHSFPRFEPSLTWQNGEHLATLLPSKMIFKSNGILTTELARAFYLLATGIDPSKLKSDKVPALNRWARYADARLTQAVDRCFQEGPVRISDIEELREALSGAPGPRNSVVAAKSKPEGGLNKVAGMQALKSLLLEEVIKPVRDPEPYRQYGLTIPNGVLLFGPPGCGKTYIARQLAEELGHFFVEIIPSELASPFIHQSVLKIRETFDLAAERAPSVLFIDEFEALVPSRADLSGHQQYKSEEVNEFLAHLNECSKKNVFVIAATNEPQKIDAAVRRTGRLDKLIYVGPPDEEARREMLEHHLVNRPRGDDLQIEKLATLLSGYAASDIKFLVDEAAREAMKHNSKMTMECFATAAARIPASIPPEIETQYQAMQQRGAAS